VQDKIGPTDPEDTGETPELHISNVEPHFGPAKGGVEVAIQLLESCANATVQFGGSGAVLVEQSSNQVLVKTPALEGGQWVDVEVICDEGRAISDQAYQVFPDADGRVRSTGEFSWVEHIGGYWQEWVEDFGFVKVYLFEPIDFDYSAFYGMEMDHCESGYSLGSIPIESMAPLTNSLTLTSGSDSMVLNYDDTEGYFARDLVASDYAKNVSYDLEPFGETQPWSDASIESFVRTPSGELSITKPAMNDSFLPIVSREFDLAWPGAGQGDYILVRIDRYVSDTSYEGVRCLLRDDGHFRVGSDVFQDWSRNELIMIRLGRVKQALGSFPQDDAGSGMIGVYWVKGAGVQE